MNLKKIEASRVQVTSRGHLADLVGDGPFVIWWSLGGAEVFRDVSELRRVHLDALNLEGAKVSLLVPPERAVVP